MNQTQIGFRRKRGAQFQLSHIITRAERDAFHGPIEEMVREVAPDVAESMYRTLLRHVVRERLDRVCSDGVMALKLDVVVFSPEELESELMEAYARGMAAVQGRAFNVD